jgi:hypothetical protein
VTGLADIRVLRRLVRVEAHALANFAIELGLIEDTILYIISHMFQYLMMLMMMVSYKISYKK